MGERNWRVAVVGAGPAGMFATDALVKRGASVDIFEALLAPYGLVRYGVAPDHQKIKRTQAVFERTLRKPGVRLFANVRVGLDLTLAEIQRHYDQVLISIGSSGARNLEVPGEDLKGSVSATAFVNWYNGHPEFQDRSYDLSHNRAVVVGMGNVAIDVARILVRDPDDLALTDITPAALSALRRSHVREVVLLARRGPNQAAFDEKEVRELAALEGIAVGVAGYVSRRKTPKSDFVAAFPRAEQLPRSKKRVILQFCVSPKKVVGIDRVEGVEVERNDLVESAMRMKAVGSGEFSKIETGFLVRAIGYNGTALAGAPFQQASGTIPHVEGRVTDEADGQVVKGLYVAGWIKRGPTGLVGTNKTCAVETVIRMEEDLDQIGPLRDLATIPHLLSERGVRFISAPDWLRLDREELQRGSRTGKIREKFTELSDALSYLSEMSTGRST